MPNYIHLTFKEKRQLTLFNPINGHILGHVNVLAGQGYDFRQSEIDSFYELEFPFGLWAKVHKSEVVVSDPEVIRISWDYTDVLEALDKQGSEDEQDIEYAKKILDYAARHHDANDGISWETFRAIDIIGI